MAALGAALGRTTLPAALLTRLSAWRVPPARVVLALALGAIAHAWIVRHAVLLDAPITDDESVYDFIAQTLARGRVTNPLPPEPERYATQFVVMNEGGWYGKYPIGHGLVIALVGLTQRVDLVGPLLASLSLWLTWQLGRRLFGERRALLGVGLLALSPHFVFTHATRLSQTTSGATLLAALLGAYELTRGGGWRWGALTGGALAFGVLARPMPGLPIAAAILGVLALSGRTAHLPGTQRIPASRLLGTAALAGLGAAAVLATNAAQAGAALRSGYVVAHGGHGFGAFGGGTLTNSIGGALVRENAWLFGWPFSLLLALFGRPRRGAALYVAALAAELSYRVLVPKTVLTLTGPIYVTETVPLLALGSADGAVRLADWLARAGVAEARARLLGVVAAAFAVAACTFIPIQLKTLHRAGTVHDAFRESLAAIGARHHALVFCDTVVDIRAHITWAYYPPPPSPDLDDDVLFVRPDPDGNEDADRAFWLRRHPDREAFVVRDTAGGRVFTRLERTPTPPAAPATAD